VLRVLLLPVPAFGLLTAHVAKDDDKTEADAGHYHSADAVEFVALEYAVVTILVTRPATTREEAILHPVRSQGSLGEQRRPSQHRIGLVEPRHRRCWQAAARPQV